MKKMKKDKKIATEWLNNKIIRVKNVPKPCHFCNYCPYGQLVEEFPITLKKTKYSCKTFGHNCPVFYHAEGVTE